LPAFVERFAARFFLVMSRRPGLLDIHWIRFVLRSLTVILDKTSAQAADIFVQGQSILSKQDVDQLTSAAEAAETYVGTSSPQLPAGVSGFGTSELRERSNWLIDQRHSARPEIFHCEDL
jgi:hypothetical protein